MWIERANCHLHFLICVVLASSTGFSALASAAHLGADTDDRWLACMPFFHVGGLSILV